MSSNNSDATASARDCPPRVLHAPVAASSESEHAYFLGAAYGLRLHDWQRLVLDHWLGITGDELWASPRVGLAVPRQNGKNAVIEVRELFGMVVLGERILHTAHEVKTARKAFKRLLDFFDNPKDHPELAALVKEIRRTNGQEAIVLHNGGQVEFVARSKGSGRGFSVDVLVLDEAQELSDDEYAALLPTISTSLNPQQILTGTPPGPKACGEVFNRIRAAGVAGSEPRLCWIEWSCVPGDDVDDRANWGDSNPEAGGLLAWETIADERAAMDPTYFGRERMGVWYPASRAVAVLDPLLWSALSVGSHPPTAPVLGIEVRLGRTGTVLGAAWPIDTKPHTQIVDDLPGTDWVVNRCVTLSTRYGVDTVVLDGGTEAASLIPALEDAGLTVVKLGGPERAAACGHFYDLASTAGMTHNGDPALSVALANARWKDVGEGSRVFTRRASAGDIAALYAALCAIHGLGVARVSDPGVYVI